MVKSIIVCDDDIARSSDWGDAVRPFADTLDLDVIILTRQQFLTEISPLEQRRLLARGESSTPPSSLLDEADVVVVDFDLVAFNEFLTGETVAYLARCFSACGYIIGLNQFGAAPFDLTLRGHVDSFADLNLGGQQLSNAGLWGAPFVGFRPWSWPLLGQAIEDFRTRSAQTLGRLEQSVADTLFPESVAQALPRSKKEFLVAEDQFLTATYQDFVVHSGNALQAKDAVRPERLSPEQLGRIAAARLAKWLERSILPGQDLVVDAPHLVTRFPSLLKGDPDDIETWNATAHFERDALGEVLQLELLTEFEVNADRWFSRPCWWWPEVSQSTDIPEVAEPWEGSAPDFVFCEDISRFAPSTAAREFVADVESPFARRFVLDRGSEEGKALVESMRSVSGSRWGADVDPMEMEYRPAVRFVL